MLTSTELNDAIGELGEWYSDELEAAFAAISKRLGRPVG